MFKKIVLLGYMGSGKTTVGRLLSEKTGLPFTDLDSFISDREGINIQRIFEKKGEIYFRKAETRYLHAILDRDKKEIIGLGGGTPCYGSNMRYVVDHNHTASVYLSAQPETLCQRLFDSRKERPLISHIDSPEVLLDFIRKHLFERGFYYSQAHFTLTTDKKTLGEVVAELRQITGI